MSESTETIETLTKMKTRIEAAGAEVSRLEGQEEEILRRLEKEHGVGDEKEGAKKLKQLRADSEKMEEELDSMVAELETELEELEQ